jgi:hypothetical protein
VVFPPSGISATRTSDGLLLTGSSASATPSNTPR